MFESSSRIIFSSALLLMISIARATSSLNPGALTSGTQIVTGLRPAAFIFSRCLRTRLAPSVMATSIFKAPVSLPVAEVRDSQHLVHNALAVRVGIDQLDLASEPGRKFRAVDVYLLFAVLAHPLCAIGHGSLHLLHVTYWRRGRRFLVLNPLCAIGHGSLHLLHVTYWRRAVRSSVQASFGANSPAA